MDNIKQSLIDDMVSTYSQLEPIFKEIENLPTKEIPKSEQLEWGSKALRIQELSLKLNITLDLYLKNFNASELPQAIKEYKETIDYLKNQIENPSTDDFKKFKEEIDKLKTN